MTDPAWVEVSLKVDGEMAEAVAEVLSRFAPNGIVTESTTIVPDEEGEGRPAGPVRVCGYLPADEHLEETRRRLEEALYFLSRIRPEAPLPPAQYRPIEETNWVEAWKKNYNPIAIGKKLIIVPVWLESPSDQRIPIRIEPGMAFGTGTHPTTQLCLELMEDLVRPGEMVIDIGSGSGILSIAALKLGASHALGVDTDPITLPSARQNAANNDITTGLELGVGSVSDILAGSFSIRKAHLVVANILAPVLIRLLEDGLVDLVSPGGILIFSGILEEQWQGREGDPSMQDALRKHDLQVSQILRRGDWVALAVVARMNLVTGSTGFVGSRLCRALIEAGQPLRAFHRSSSSLEALEHLGNRSFEHTVGDITQPETLKKAMQGVENGVPCRCCGK
jgi:ribosomal protein L11 methyltransferase